MTTASELTDLACTWLREMHPHAMIVRELGCAAWGGALIDVAAILPEKIVGVEIKGEGDSPTRLDRQGMMYSRVARTMFLLPDASLLDRCLKRCPPGWGVLAAEQRSAEWTSSGSLWRRRFTGHDGLGLGLAPAALVTMVWTREYPKFTAALGYAFPKRRDKQSITELVTERSSLREIERAVCAVLLTRDWSPKTVDFPDDARARAEKRLGEAVKTGEGVQASLFS